MADTAGHDVHFESADAGASLTYPQQAGTVRKNGFLVIKGRPCKVSLLCTSRSFATFSVSSKERQSCQEWSSFVQSAADRSLHVWSLYLLRPVGGN